MPSPDAERGPSLRLVCINDVYSLENLPRLRTLVQDQATRDPADMLLVTLAGDFVAPSMLSSLDAGRGMIDCLNAIPVTHVTFGNHEDDIPADELRKRTLEFGGTWLATNVPGFGLPLFQLLDIGHDGGRRVRVGLLGVVMDDPTLYRGKPFGGATLLPASEIARHAAAHLVAHEKCACVIPLTHQSIDADRALARAQQAPPFPVILGGHEHTVFLEQIDATWLVKAGSDAIHAAIVDLRWPPVAPAGAPDLPRVEVRLVEVAHFPEDAALRARVDGHMRAVRDLEQATLLPLSPGDELSSIGTRSRQTSLGTLVCSRLRDAFCAEGCVFNGGGIRAGRAYHQRFTYGDLKAELPFDNEVVVASLPGRVLRDAIAASRARAPVESGGFFQIDDGMATDPSGRTLVAVAGAPLDPDRDYRIALVRNLFDGMDRNEPLIAFARSDPHRVPPAGSGREAKVALVEAFSRALWERLGGFDAIDENHDGLVDSREIARAVERATAEPASPITVDLLLKALDTDRDRVISRQEAERGKRPPG